MADKKSNKISIKPMTNVAAIASTLGINANDEWTIETRLKQTGEERTVNSEGMEKISQSAKKSQIESSKGKNERQITINPPISDRQEREADVVLTPVSKVNQSTIKPAANQKPEMPFMIEIKRKFPGKELFILSLLYLNRNNRGLVQMTVGNMMALYSTVFDDVIKDDTVRRSLKRLFDAGFIKTTSIPGNNSGYIYEIGDLLEGENFSQTEKEEFAELNEFVKSKTTVISSLSRSKF